MGQKYYYGMVSNLGEKGGLKGELAQIQGQGWVRIVVVHRMMYLPWLYLFVWIPFDGVIGLYVKWWFYKYVFVFC